MPNITYIQGGLWDIPEYIAGGNRGFYTGSYCDRRRRFDVRCARRGGDLFFLGVPTVVLWADDDYFPGYELEY